MSAACSARAGGVLVGALDILKGFVPAYVFGVLGGQTSGEVAGLAAVLGHITSPLPQGQGEARAWPRRWGRSSGVQPLLAIPVLLAFGLGVLIWHRVGLGAVLAAVVLAISGFVGWRTGLDGRGRHVVSPSRSPSSCSSGTSAICAMPGPRVRTLVLTDSAAGQRVHRR
jgi:glycerol-3-phosphate acyltransferase PlsY